MESESVTLHSRLQNLQAKLRDRSRQATIQLRRKLLKHPAHPLLFEHVPKCGGTTVNDFLGMQYLCRERFEIDGMNVDHGLSTWQGMSAEERQSYRLLAGHGAHKLRHLFWPEAKRLTIIREPVDRMISHYHFARTSPNHYLFETINKQQLSLEQYASSGLSPEIINNYARRFAGITSEESRRAPEESAHRTLEIMLSEYSVIGFTDNLDAAMIAIGDQCQFPFPAWKPERRNTNHLRPRQLNDSTIELIQQINAADVLLFKMLRERANAAGCVIGTK